MILAGGHYKQTQSNYVIAAVLNILISILMVKFYGLIGVAIGTLVAMVYQTVWMAWYVSKNLINWPFQKFLKQCFIDALVFLIAYPLSGYFKLDSVTYWGWIVLGIKVAPVWLTIVLAVNGVFRTAYVAKLLGALIKNDK